MPRPDQLSALAAAVALAWVSITPVAHAQAAGDQSMCHDYKSLVAELDSRYDEEPVSLGVQTNGDLLQVFSSKEQRTWTILSVSPSGKGCILAAGRSWESVPVSRPEPAA